MKSFLSILFIGLIAVSFGCKKEEAPPQVDPIKQFGIDLGIIDTWLIDNNIQDVIIHPESKIRYTISEIGTGLSPIEVTDTVVVDYEGWLLDTQEVFDSGTSFAIQLGSTISGWQIMLREMKEGDKFTIYLPSVYGYGTKGVGSIPPNANLVFDIKLIRINN
jgi:FKBP-type peptidyl-prolyl cis-trans isomerase FkpA